MTALLVVLGASLGAPTRLLVSRRVAGPRGTLVVNVLGSLLIGLFTGLSAAPYALLAIGFCGAFTTYSTFAVETVELRPRAATSYVVLSVVLCCAACALGLLAG
jgi:CrcB protein